MQTKGVKYTGKKSERKAGIQSFFPEQTIFTVGLVRLRNHCHYHLVVIIQPW